LIIVRCFIIVTNKILFNLRKKKVICNFYPFFYYDALTQYMPHSIYILEVAIKVFKRRRKIMNRLEDILQAGYNIEIRQDNEIYLTIHGHRFDNTVEYKVFKGDSLDKVIELAYIFITRYLKGVSNIFKSVVEIENEANNYDYEEHLRQTSKIYKHLDIEALRESCIRMKIYILCDIEIKKIDDYLLSKINVEKQYTKDEEIKSLRLEIKKFQEEKGLH